MCERASRRPGRSEGPFRVSLGSLLLSARSWVPSLACLGSPSAQPALHITWRSCSAVSSRPVLSRPSFGDPFRPPSTTPGTRFDQTAAQFKSLGPFSELFVSGSQKK